MNNKQSGEGMHIARNVGHYGNATIEPTYYGGHCLYVRKCMTGEADGDDPYERVADGIVLPEQSVDQTCFVEVLAVGRNVGKRCSEAHAREWRSELVKKYGLTRARRSYSLPPNIIGARAYIYLPVDHYDQRCKRSPLSDQERFIEETLPLYYEVA
jgi:hypothetical protein